MAKKEVIKDEEVKVGKHSSKHPANQPGLNKDKFTKENKGSQDAYA